MSVKTQQQLKLANGITITVSATASGDWESQAGLELRLNEFVGVVTGRVQSVAPAITSPEALVSAHAAAGTGSPLAHSFEFGDLAAEDSNRLKISIVVDSQQSIPVDEVRETLSGAVGKLQPVLRQVLRGEDLDTTPPVSGLFAGFSVGRAFLKKAVTTIEEVVGDLVDDPEKAITNLLEGRPPVARSGSRRGRGWGSQSGDRRRD